MARSGLRTEAMSNPGKPTQPGLTRRKLAAGFLSILALVSSVALVAQPAPPPEPAEPNPPIDMTFPEVESPIVVPERNGDPVIESVRVLVDCNAQRECTIEASGMQRDPLEVCTNHCRSRTARHTVTPGSLGGANRELEVVDGFRRLSPTTREIVFVLASDVAPDEYIRVQPAVNGELIFDEVGAAGMEVTATYDEAPSSAVSGDDGTPVLIVVLAGVLILAAAGVGLFALYAMVLAILGAPSPRVRSVDDDDDDEEKVEEDLPVDAPLALAQPVTKEVAQERAEVARDLLDRVRDIEDPRLSIQTGFSLLETGFGRMHLARRRNETSGAYVTRVFGDHEDLRPTMREISQIFERARFSDLPVDAEMRMSMINQLAEVKDTWEQEAFLLSDQIPAPPTVLSPAGVPTVDDQPSAQGENPYSGSDE